MRKRCFNFELLLVFILTLMISGCVGGEDAKPISDMTQKERLVIILGTYNSQYADYMRVTGYIKGVDGEWKKMSSPELTDEQKAILVKKKAVLTEVYPLIALYENYESSGRVVSPSTETEIFNLLDSLVALVPD